MEATDKGGRLLPQCKTRRLGSPVSLELQLEIKDKKLSFYQRFSGSELPKLVGIEEGNLRRSTGEPGHLAFGPYLSLEPGNYVAAFYIRRSGPVSGATIDFDVNVESVGQLSHVRLTDSELFTNIAGQVAMPFTLTQAVSGLEARIFVEASVLVEVHELVVFSVDFKRWAA